MSRAGRSAKAPSQRQLRVGEELRHALAEIFLRGELRDPALHGVSLTVAEVRVSADLRNATVFVIPLGGGGGAEMMAALERCTPYLRGQVAGRVRLRYVPTLVFAADPSFDYAERIDSVLRALEPASPPARDEAGDEDGA